MSQVAIPQETSPTPLTEPAPRKTGTLLTLLALVFGAAGLGAGGWGIWQVRQLQTEDPQLLNQLTAVRNQAQSTETALAALRTEVASLPRTADLQERYQVLAELQSDQQQLSRQVRQALGQSREEWRLAEAEYLLRLASLRLSALQDVDGAIELLKGADDILRLQGDPSAFAARAELTKGLEALRSLPRPDRTGLFLQLAALRDQLAQLQSQAPSFNPATPASSPGADRSTWSGWWEGISRQVQIDFNATQDIRPVLFGQELSQMRLALSLSLEQAQWAALNGQQEVYQKALQQAQQILQDFFAVELPEGRALKTRLSELSQQPVKVQVPDLSPALNSLQAYLARRNRVAPQETAPTGEQP